MAEICCQNMWEEFGLLPASYIEQHGGDVIRHEIEDG